jgi:alcohol dehydrogenase
MRVSSVGTPPIDDLKSTWGGYAEWGIAKDHWAMAADGVAESEWSGWRWNQIVPSGVDPRVAPLFTTWRETASLVKRIGLRSGERVLVLGAGGNGLAFAKMARLLGAGKVALTGAPKLRAAALATGADLFVDYHHEKITEPLAEFAPYDVIIDSVGRAGQLDRVLPLAASRTRITIYGIDDLGKVSVTPTLAPAEFSFYPGGYDEAETHQEISDWTRQGRLTPKAWYEVNATYDLRDLPAAFRALAERKSAKALIRME